MLFHLGVILSASDLLCPCDFFTQATFPLWARVEDSSSALPHPHRSGGPPTLATVWLTPGLRVRLRGGPRTPDALPSPVGTRSRACSAPAAAASCAPSSARGAARASQTPPTRGSRCSWRAAGTASWRRAKTATAAPARSGPRARSLGTTAGPPTSRTFPEVRALRPPVPSLPFPSQKCQDPCCFAHNCSLRAGAQCAHGDCCARCQVRAPKTWGLAGGF